MKVVHVSTADWIGGAARAAYRLHAGLRELSASRANSSLESTMLVASRASGDPSVQQFRPATGNVARSIRGIRNWRIQTEVCRATRGRASGFEPFSTEQSVYREDLVNCLPDYDVINLHWVSELVDYEHFLPQVCARGPVVWTLHDMNVLTGGCHYDEGCGRFSSECRQCPQLSFPSSHDLSSRVFARKREIFSRLKSNALHIVAPSEWLAEQARSSPFLGRFDISVIPYGLDTRDFSPLGIHLCREALRIPRDRKVVLFVAQSSTMRRKGFTLLQAALSQLNDANLFVLSVGGGDPHFAANASHLHLGNVEHDHLLALAYGAADVFVVPSLQDNLPNTVLESMACGTPVVGFSVGGIPDMVRPMETGLLAPAGDIDALAAAISRLLNDVTLRQKMSTNCRRIAVAEYSSPVQATAYESLYQSLVEHSKIVAGALR